ncbi:protease [Aviadenovirus phalacrocoracidae]|uniref:Protease n=1 Tax=Aviadenovirus sp. TaxID=2217649 RepID=A0ABZ0T1J1_9ADEN|nr:protease [Aviadenovirus sp.]
MSGTTDSQLRDLVASMHVRHRFLGVFDKNFPGFLHPNERASAIVNTGSRASGGLHWIGFAFEPHGKKCYMFDPFGWSDTKLWELYKFKYEAFMRRTGLSQRDRCFELIKSNEAVQCPCSAACGLFSALFIASFDRYPLRPMDGNPVIDTVIGVKHENMYKPQFREVLHRNQERMYLWFMKNNPYFRANEERLKSETAIESIPENHAMPM